MNSILEVLSWLTIGVCLFVGMLLLLEHTFILVLFVVLLLTMLAIDSTAIVK